MKTTLRAKARRAGRALARLNPIRIFQDWSYDGWGEHGFTPTWKSRVGDAVMWKVNVATAIALALTQKAEEDLAYQSWWARPLYRVKTALCLIAGRHWKGEHCKFDCIEMAWWNGERTGYYEPEWEDSHVSVGLGWGNWRVLLELRWP